MAGLLVGAVASLAVFAKDDAGQKAAKQEKERSEIMKATSETLSRLYKAQPEAKTAIQKAAGYAAFSNFGMKILVAGSGTGKGIAVNNATKAKTYMKMVELQAGFGFGVKKFRLVWVFESQKELDQFINSGWELGGRRPQRPGGREGRGVRGGDRRLSRSLALPDHRRRARAGADRQGNQVLQGRRSELDGLPALNRPGVSTCPFRELCYLIFDNDKKHGAEVLAVIEHMGIRRKQITPHSPWQNGVAERWIQTVRRDLLDHVIVLNERHLHRLLSEFVAYYHHDRTHLGLGKDTPSMRVATSKPSSNAEIVGHPRIGGIHHRYEWHQAA